MRKLTYLWIALLISVLTAGGASANTVATTYQEWHFDTGANPAFPEVDLNDYGTATIDISVTGDVYGTAGHYPDNWLGRSGVWHGDITTLTITVPNNPIPNEYKEVWVEVGFRGSLMEWGIIDPPAGAAFLGSTIEDVGAGWQKLNIGWEIRPNPDSETIFLEFWDSGADVDYVIVDTICVPEPMTICLLGLGGLALLRKRK